MNIVTRDPMLALIYAAHATSQGAMEELSTLAKDQQESNERLRKLRNLESKFREIRGDHNITRAELDSIKREIGELKKSDDITIDINAELDALYGGLSVEGSRRGDRDEVVKNGIPVKKAADYGWVNYEGRAGDYLHEDKNGTCDNWKSAAETLDSIKEAITDAKENIKGDAANRELDIQRVTQEVSSAMQLESNLSKSWSDVSKAIIGNMRA